MRVCFISSIYSTRQMANAAVFMKAIRHAQLRQIILQKRRFGLDYGGKIKARDLR